MYHPQPALPNTFFLFPQEKYGIHLKSGDYTPSAGEIT
jgi:hypothetical protein